MGSLQARGERGDYLLTNIFKEYKVASDIKFIASIDLWESNWIQGDDLTSELIMTKSFNDYNMKVLRKTWWQQSDDKRSIVSLTAELQIVKDSNIKTASILRGIKKNSPADTSGSTKRYNLNDLKHAW